MKRKRSAPAHILLRVGQAAAAAAVLWALGFVGFVLSLPGPAPLSVKTDAVAVLTGGPGRIQRGSNVLLAGSARRMLVSGVDSRVKPAEFRAANDIPESLMRCCIDLGFVADSTRSNASEVGDWMAGHRFRSVRLVTTGYHMPRARAEIRARLGSDVLIVPDAVPGQRTLVQMALEYSKFLAARAMLMVYPSP